VMAFGTSLAEQTAQDPLVVVWLLLPIAIIPGMILVLFIRPDPKVIAQNLARYYPGYVPERTTTAGAAGTQSSLRTLLSFFPLRAAFAANFAVQGVMSMMMAMTSLALAHHEYALPLISVAVSIHVMGMYGLSVPLGRLVDRLGRRNMMLLGVTISAFGSVLIPTSDQYAVITSGTFLVGLGWAAVNVASSALIVDVVGPLERGRAVGTSDTFSQMSAIVMPLAAGPLVAIVGLPSLSVLALMVLAVPVLLLVRLREIAPGKFDHSYAGLTAANEKVAR
jgi:MFS family permease